MNLKVLNKNLILLTDDNHATSTQVNALFDASQYYNPVATRNYSKYVGEFGSKFKQCQRAFSFSSSRVITYLRAYRKSPLLNYVSCASQILGQSLQYRSLQQNQFVLMVQYEFNSFTCRSFKIQINSISGLIPGHATINMPWPYARSSFFSLLTW